MTLINVPNDFDILLHIAMCLENEKYKNQYYDSSKYKIELGISLLDRIIYENTDRRDKFSYIISNNNNMIMGVPFEVNYQNPYEFKLWKEVS